MRKTGLKDAQGLDIYENEIIRVGMRVADPGGWTSERVVNARKGWRRWLLKPVWLLENPSRPDDGLMDMQKDERLRIKVNK